MDRLSARDLHLFELLSQLEKPYLSVADLEKILGLKRESLYVALHRLVRSGALNRLRRGVYHFSLRPEDLPRIANLLYQPSYVSFESAMARYGIVSQVPYTVTFATPRRTKRMRLGDTQVEFHQVREDLFFGYVLEQALYVAEPEKALLDQVYLKRRGKVSLALEDLDLSGLNVERLREYARRFPAYVGASLQELLPFSAFSS